MGSIINKRYLGRTGFQISELGLGTVELGLRYGISSRVLPSDEDAITLLKRATECGMNFIDTAHSYGVSEERIGKSGILKNDGIVLATKCGTTNDSGISDTELESIVRQQVEESLKKLFIGCIPLLQIHETSVDKIENGAYERILGKLKKEGKVRYIGASTRGTEVSLKAIECGLFDTIQIAYSILDQRMIHRVITEADNRHIGIINRSVLLKGVLTESAKILPPSLEVLASNASIAETIARSIGTTLPKLALRFALSNICISTVLVGSTNIRHIEEAIEASTEGPLSTEVLNELKRLAIDNPLLVDPKNWPI